MPSLIIHQSLTEIKPTRTKWAFSNSQREEHNKRNQGGKKMEGLDLRFVQMCNERHQIAKRNERARNYSALKRNQRNAKIREIKNNIMTTVLLLVIEIVISEE